MTMLELIRKQIEKEVEKVYYINSDPNPRYALEMIILRISHLKKLEAEEFARALRAQEITTFLVSEA